MSTSGVLKPYSQGFFQNLEDGLQRSLETNALRVLQLASLSTVVELIRGTRELNERWPCYWAHQFAQHTSAVNGGVQDLFWDDPSTEPWIAQRISWIAEAESRRCRSEFQDRRVRNFGRPASSPHSRVGTSASVELISLRNHLSLMTRATRRSIRRRFTRFPRRI